MIRRFDTKSKNITKDALLTTQDPEIIYEILNGIFYGIKNDLQEVDLFEIKDGEDFQTFCIPRTKWKKALEKCMSKMIEIENYEMCSLIKEEIRKIS